MKAPNKIYIPFYLNDDGIDTYLGDDWFDSKDIDQYVEGWKEYIRKDTMIELIKEESKFWDDGEMIFRGLIEKLNSM